MSEPAIDIFEPMHHQREFFDTDKKVRVMRGGWRSGKTTCGAVLVAKELLRPGSNHKVAVVVGYDCQHLSYLYKRLFLTGSFKSHSELPPLIPSEFVKESSWLWHDKQSQCPSSCNLKNGCVVYFVSSRSSSHPFITSNVTWIDESVDRDSDVFDFIDRTTCLFIWTAFPACNTQALRAVESMCDASVSVVDTTQNKYAMHSLLASSLKLSDAKMRTRIYGDFPLEKVTA